MSFTALGFLAIYSIGLFLALLRHPLFGLGAYLWAFYMAPPSQWWGADLPNWRWSLCAAIVTLIATLRLERPVARPAWHASWGVRFLIAYVVWMWLQNAWAVNSSYHLEGCLLFTKYIVLIYVVYRVVQDEKTFSYFSWGHIAGCFLFGWFAYNATVSGRLESVGGGSVTDANLLAMHQITGIAFAGFMFLGIQGKKRWLAFATLPFILNSIILAASRGAFVGLLGGALAALSLSPRSHRRLVIGAIALGAVLVTMLANDLFWNRLGTIWETKESEMEASARSRIELIHYGWQMAQDHPFGAGHRGHEVLSQDYLPDHLLTGEEGQRRRSGHNTLMVALVEQGYPGAMLYLALQAWIFMTLWRLKSLDRLGLSSSLAIYRAALGTALVASFICGQFVNMLKAEVVIWFVALLYILQNLSYEEILELSYHDDNDEDEFCDEYIQEMVSI